MHLVSPVLLLASLLIPALSTAYKYQGLDWYYPPLPLPVKVLHQFPVGTWMSSIAVRSNGRLLVTALSTPEILEVDNHGVKPIKEVHTFANATGCTGITKYGHDVYYVITGMVSVTPPTAVGNTWSVYRIDVRHHHPHTTDPKPAVVSWVANFPDGIMLSSIIMLNHHKQWFLVSDSGAGVVYRLEAKTGTVVKVLDDPLMKPDSSATLPIGIRAMKTKDNQLFFTNTNQNILGRIRLEPDGTSRGSAYLVARVDAASDFVFNESENVVVVQNAVDRLGRVTGNKVVNLAGGVINGTSLLYGPTSLGFGRIRPFLAQSRADWMKAYITTNGGTQQYLDGNITRGGTVSVVDVRGYW